MKIAFFGQNDLRGKRVKNALKEHHLEFYENPLTARNVNDVKDFEIISVYYNSKIDEQIIKQLPKLKLIVAGCTGIDNVDIEACKKENITVCNVPCYCINTVAEHTFALILSLARNIHKAYVKTQRNDFSVKGLKGFDLKGKTIGVVGTGRVGLYVIKIAKGFGMTVLAHDIKEKTYLSDLLGFTYTSLDEVLSKSDIITLHVSEKEQNQHLINKDNIDLIKKGAILINTSRGYVVDTKALIKALREGILFGAGLDVLENEEFLKKEKSQVHDNQTSIYFEKSALYPSFFNKYNIVFTPHMGYYTTKSLERLNEAIVENILAFISGNPINVV